MALNKADSMKRVQSLIKGWMLDLEQTPSWQEIDPRVINTVRRAIVRVAWGAYKTGVLTGTGLEKE